MAKQNDNGNTSEQPEAPASTPRNKWLDQSITSVLRYLGSEGVSVQEARAIVDAEGIAVNPSTITIQIGQGRRVAAGEPSKYHPTSLATVTKKQLAEWRKVAKSALAEAA
jgi:hypothetical protein